MSSDPNIHTDIAMSILEHAESIGRLDAAGMSPTAYDAAVATHVSAMRVLAVPHMDPQPDRELVRQLRALLDRTPSVQMRLADGGVLLIVDAVRRQHTFKLWNRQQFARNEEDDEFDGS